jgi:hypothetical protein
MCGILIQKHVIATEIGNKYVVTKSADGGNQPPKNKGQIILIIEYITIFTIKNKANPIHRIFYINSLATSSPSASGKSKEVY